MSTVQTTASVADINKITGLQSTAAEIDGVVGNINKYGTINTFTVLPSTWEIGGITSGGTNAVASDRYRSGYIDISGMEGTISLKSFYTMYRINQYSETFTHVGQISTESTSYTISNPSVKYIRIVVLSTLYSSYDVLNIVSGQINIPYFRTAIEYGFSPTSSPSENVAALNEALSKKGKVVVDIVGEYFINDSIIIGDDTELEFVKGAVLRRTSNNGYAIVNSGAFTKTYNKNIKIKGLELICNNYQSKAGTLISGLRGQLAFHYVKELVIEDFKCNDLGNYSYAIHVCTFENLKIHNHIVTGNKDAVHLGTGSKFIISNGIYKTYDDPIALNGHDYSTGNPELGWITDGIISNCYDLNDASTTGYFCRILAGAWVDWFSGMSIQNSDTVVSNGRLYRAINSADGTIYTSTTQPTHATGTVSHEGINWKMTQEVVTYSAGVKNVHFKDIFLQKNRPTGFSIHFDKDYYSRSYYPNAVIPVQEDIIFENIFMGSEIQTLISSRTPINTVKVINSTIGNTKISLSDVTTEGMTYPSTSILLSGCTFKGSGAQTLVECVSPRTATLKTLGSIKENASYTPSNIGSVTVLSSDI